MTLIDRFRFWWSSILVYAKSMAPDREDTNSEDWLAAEERRLADNIKSELADDLGIDPAAFEDVDPPSQQNPSNNTSPED